MAAFVVRSVRPSFWAAVCRGRVTPEDGAIKNTGRSSFQERGRAISTARLCALPRLHLQPIYVVVCDGPMGRSYLGEGFVLRCFQHLSWPDADTRPCTWRYNRLTGGLSVTVLSY